MQGYEKIVIYDYDGSTDHTLSRILYKTGPGLWGTCPCMCAAKTTQVDYHNKQYLCVINTALIAGL